MRSERVLYAIDGELTGLIGATVLMRPSRSIDDLETKSVLKNTRTSRFAAGCSREVPSKGAGLPAGWSLDRLITRTIEAMKATGYTPPSRT